MSFFRNLRSSITRGRSSSRDTTPVRSSRPGSVISGMGSSNKRRDSVESGGTDSAFNRSGTFILDDPNENNGLHSNTSTLEKKSKKSKVLEKFSTFTKRKKTPTPDSSALDHHPSDNATNTYYKWQADGSNSLDYDSQTDPFNFLYEQTSLKSLHNGSSASATPANDSPRVVHSATPVSGSSGHPTFDSSTYRKGKMPSELKKQLEQLKHSRNFDEQEDDDPSGDHELDDDYFKRTGLENGHEADKYKTVTLNSFRKSFRDKFLQQQKEAPHNPAWFVEVDPPAESPRASHRERSMSKENRSDFLVFENENYRPGSRSPVRDLNCRKPARSITRSPVKRNDTFKVDRSNATNSAYATKTEETAPSIRIEFRNSIAPHMPGRMVPVGVAKPMPSQIPATYYAARPETTMNTSYTVKTSKTRLNGSHSPQRNWSKPMSRSPSRSRLGASNQTTTTGRYQTLVQIKNDANMKLQQPAPLTTRPSRLSTRIQLGGGSSGLQNTLNSNSSPSFAKRYASSHQNNVPARTNQPLRQTYFGDNNHYTSNNNNKSSPLTSSRMGQSPAYASGNITTTTKTMYGQKNATTTPAYHSKYQVSSTSSIVPTHSQLQSRSTPSYSAIGGGGGGVPSYLKHQQQQQSRFVVPAQRRSRSPIKIPWR